MELIIVRHGETFENLKGISQGHLNSQLTPRGIEQAIALSHRLKDVKIDIAFSSDLDRALNTCNEILKFHPETELMKTTILREQSKGVFEGKSNKERNRLLKDNDIPFHEWLPEGGERLIDVWDKVIPFFENIKRDHFDKTVLLVSHGGPISCLLAYLHGKDIEHFGDYVPRENAAISVVTIDENDTQFKTC
jgi:probable phosphoglycerate mutase